MTRRTIRYSAVELDWISQCRDLPRREMHAIFVAAFNRPDVTIQDLCNLCERKGWLTGRTGCFEKGSVPLNKGRKGTCAPGSEKGWFRKGQRPHSAKMPGYETIGSDGYVMLCVAERNPWTGASTRMVQKHRWLWEKANGPVPAGMRLKSLDGDRTNTDPSNWLAIPMALGPRLNGRFGRGYDQAPAELKPLIMATAQLELAARQARREGKA